MAGRDDRPPSRLSAAGGRAARRYRRGEHLAARRNGRSGQGRRSGHGRRHPRDGPAPAAGLQDPTRPARHRALRRPASAHRPGPCALRQSLPGRDGRTELQPRWRGRGGTHRSNRAGQGARRHRRHRRPSSQRAAGGGRCRPDPGGKLVAFGPRDKILPPAQPRAAAGAPASAPAPAERAVPMPRAIGIGDQPATLHGRVPA